MREFKYGAGVIALDFLLNLLLVKMSEKSLTKADFWSKNHKKICPTTVDHLMGKKDIIARTKK